MKIFCIPIGDRSTRGNFNLPPTIDERPTAVRESIESFKTSEPISNGAVKPPLESAVPSATIREEEEPEPQPVQRKREGNIAESMNKEPQYAEDIKTRRYSKDSSSEKLQKDAIIGNEFLTNLDPAQVDDGLDNLPDSSFVVTQREPEYDYITLKDLEFVGTLGVGRFGRVQLVQSRKDKNLTFALKCLKKVHVVEHQQEEHAYNEKAVMLQCNACPFISKLFRTYRDNKYVYFLMEPCLGGDVFNLLLKNRFFDDHTARFMTSCVVEALEYLHERGFIFRNLQPENLLLDSQGYIKMTGFGFAKHLGAGEKTWTYPNPDYIAPELLLSQGQDRAVDYWALGCLLYEFLTGRPPFVGSDYMKTCRMILKGIEAVKFPKYVQRPASDLIRRLCRAVPTERLGYQKSSVKDIKNHGWFQGFDWIALKNRTMKAPIIQPISGPTDTSNFDKFKKNSGIPPDEFSGWDKDF